mgnify:CR=1 FL=1
MKKLLAISAISLSLTSCASASDVEENSSVDETSSSSTENSAATEDERDSGGDEQGSGSAGVGDTIEGDDFTIKLNSIRTTDEGTLGSGPDEEIYLVADISITNLTDEAETVSSLLSFELQGADGFQYDQALFVDTKGSMDGDLPPQGLLRGEIAYDVPILDSYTISYQHSLFSDAVYFEFGLDDAPSAESAAETEASSESAGGTGSFASVGDTVLAGDFEITLNSVQTLSSGSLTDPDNDFFLLIDATVANNSGEDTTISSLLSFDLRGSDGFSYDIDIFAPEKGSLDGDVRAGGILRGQIAFDVVNLDYYDFTFEPSLLGSEQARFRINSSDLG